MLRGLIFSIILLLGVILLGVFMPPGIDILAWVHYPLTPAMQAIFPKSKEYFHLLALPGMLTALRCTAFAYGRVFYSLARAGLIPDTFTHINSATSTPDRAAKLGGILGWCVAMLICWDRREFHGVVHFTIYDMIIISGCIHLGLVLVAFVVLRITCANVSLFFFLEEE